MTRRRDDPSFAHFYQGDPEELNVEEYNMSQNKKQDLERGRMRRRTEDILEASRLEDDVLYEVWEKER